MSFNCPHCHAYNSEIQPGAAVRDHGVRYTLQVEDSKVSQLIDVKFCVYMYMILVPITRFSGVNCVLTLMLLLKLRSLVVTWVCGVKVSELYFFPRLATNVLSNGLGYIIICALWNSESGDF